jgi:hypothetical protein
LKRESGQYPSTGLTLQHFNACRAQQDNRKMIEEKEIKGVGWVVFLKFARKCGSGRFSREATVEISQTRQCLVNAHEKYKS